MKHQTHSLKQQKGSMMIEALAAILIFSLGILAMMGMQASAIKLSSDAKYRSDAGLLANELIGQMWTSDRTSATLVSNFQGHIANTTDGLTYKNWVLGDVVSTMPGISGQVANYPIVSVQPQAQTPSGSISNLVTITIFWKAPTDKNPPAGQVLCGVAIPLRPTATSLWHKSFRRSTCLHHATNFASISPLEVSVWLRSWLACSLACWG